MTIHQANALPELQFRAEPELSADAFVDLLRRSTLAARRPVEDRATSDSPGGS
ncbi:MAG TPA: hypothetical protein VML55_00945 [Planctomycetaceae bacterium]|nr:hypothetical protein [Planctomycetaceae bacterium]